MGEWASEWVTVTGRGCTFVGTGRAPLGPALQISISICLENGFQKERRRSSTGFRKYRGAEKAERIGKGWSEIAPRRRRIGRAWPGVCATLGKSGSPSQWGAHRPRRPPGTGRAGGPLGLWVGCLAAHCNARTHARTHSQTRRHGAAQHSTAQHSAGTDRLLLEERFPPPDRSRVRSEPLQSCKTVSGMLQRIIVAPSRVD